MTVSASVPIAVLSITLFRAFSRWFGIRQATILENNIVQTAGSAGESLAFGVGVTMPALLLLGQAALWVVLTTALVSAVDYYRRFNRAMAVAPSPKVADIAEARAARRTEYAARDERRIM